MDKTADPCSDFYQYACGGWLKKTEIPADRSMWSRSFSVIHERNIQTLHQILEDAAKNPGDDAGKKKIGDYYAACMDTKAIDKMGLKGIEPLLKVARRVRGHKTLARAITDLHQHQVWVLFGTDSMQDAKDATQVIADVDQGGLGLPDKDYYLKDDPRSKHIRDLYQAHVEKMFELAGQKKKAAAKNTARVMKLETALAKISMGRVERRDPKATYHRVPVKDLVAMDSSFPWKRYFKTMGLADLEDLNVSVPDFFKGLAPIMKKTKPATWHAYFEWHIISAAAGHNALPQKFIDENFAFRQAITGQKKLSARWKRCVASTDHALGDILGKIYVQEKFSGQSKAAAQKLVHAISHAFDQNLDTLAWMDKATTAAAHKKLSMVGYKIGYPSKWKHYDYKVSRTDFAHDVMAYAKWRLNYELAKVGKPVNREEWFMTPPTVNAYYDQQLNEVVFPAGILQPPFYSVKHAVPVNLGGMGMVVGHEFTHGFDDQGAKFDGKGNLANWWTPAAAKQFKAKTECVVNQYSQYSPVKGVHLNGKLTLGENIADIGGVKMAFRAYRDLTAGDKVEKVADGFTPDQQFFLGVGQAWCSKVRPQLAALLTKLDPHSPPQFRVDGALSDQPAFAQAFHCAVGTPMNPKNACSVW